MALAVIGFKTLSAIYDYVFKDHLANDKFYKGPLQYFITTFVLLFFFTVMFLQNICERNLQYLT